MAWERRHFVGLPRGDLPPPHIAYKKRHLFEFTTPSQIELADRDVGGLSLGRPWLATTPSKFEATVEF